MEMIVVAIRDGKAEAFGQPFFAQTIGTACRGFEDAVNRQDDQNQMFKHPGDFSLYALGKFDDVSGEFKTEVPKLLTTASDVKRGPRDSKVSKV